MFGWALTSITCMKKKMVYDGINEEVSVEENDVMMKFLHLIDPSVYLHWPAFGVKLGASKSRSQFQLLTLQGALIPS